MDERKREQGIESLYEKVNCLEALQECTNPENDITIYYGENNHIIMERQEPYTIIRIDASLSLDTLEKYLDYMIWERD